MKRFVIALILGVLFTSVSAAKCIEYQTENGARNYKCYPDNSAGPTYMRVTAEPSNDFDPQKIKPLGDDQWLYVDTENMRILRCSRFGKKIDCM